MNNQPKSKPFYIEDVRHEQKTLERQYDALLIMYTDGYEKAYERYGRRWQKVDSVLKHFKDASQKDIQDEMGRLYKKRDQLHQLKMEHGYRN